MIKNTEIIPINRKATVHINVSILKIFNLLSFELFLRELFLVVNRITIRLILENIEGSGVGTWFQFPIGFVL